MVEITMRKNAAGEVTGYVIEANGYPFEATWTEAAIVLGALNARGQKGAMRAYDRVVARRAAGK